jgi:predicted ArsR family transcriptional regulator
MAARRERTGGEAVIHALTHWLRREVLRCMQEPDVAVSAKLLEDALGVPLSNCNYHLSALEDDGLVDEIHSIPIRGAAEHFYISKVKDNAIVNAILTQTAEEDTIAVKAYQEKRAAAKGEVKLEETEQLAA